MAAWINHHRELLRNISDAAPLTRRVIENIPATNKGIAGAIALELLVVLAATIAFARWLRAANQARSVVYIYAGLLAAYIFHVVAHVAQSIFLGTYTPGVVSAVVVVLPAGGYLYSQLFRQRILSTQGAVISATAGAASILPIIAVAHMAGRWLFE